MDGRTGTLAYAVLDASASFGSVAGTDASSIADLFGSLVAGPTVDAARVLHGHPGLEASTPMPFTLGDHSGVQLDLNVAADWTATCPTSIPPAVFLMTNDARSRDRVKWIDDQHVAMWIVDVAATTVIVYLESGPSDAALAELKDLFQPTIDTFRFAPAP